MPSAQTVKQQLSTIEMKRDEYPVIFSNPGNCDAFKKHFKAARRSIAAALLSSDPAIGLKKERNRRGLA